MMVIRKLFKVNNTHIVRNCYSDRCKYSLHAHTADIEVFLEGQKLDNAGMLLDFGITKKVFKPFLDIHDNAVLIWKYDNKEYKDFIKSKTDNWIELSFTPSAELLAAYFQLHFDSFLDRIKLKNDEDHNLSIIKTRYHETRTGWAEANNIDVLSLLTDQKQVLMIDKVGDVVSAKIDEFEKNTGVLLFGDKEIEIEAPEIQVIVPRT